ncbi:peroxiredoxin [Lunatimonas salinarum]|uniref:peroxiredoxin n=1 Tax=Lunatimonas salinarum TaxID=1774590 RepID=UPI001ADF15B6|nr:peroxiredoxin [Lunatimonas salinarum]
MALKIGTKAPDFVLPSTSGKLFKLSEDWKGKGGIIYFYPKDFTGGCTTQACEFRDEFESFRDLDISIVGISKDSIATHHKFKKEYNLPFELLGDSRGKVCRDYDALIPLVHVPKRITYLIDEKHVIRAIHQDMFDSKSHIREMIAQAQKT